MRLSECYDVLGVHEDATLEEIKDAFRRRAKHLHPDANHGRLEGDGFLRLTQAYDLAKVFADPLGRRTRHEQSDDMLFGEFDDIGFDDDFPTDEDPAFDDHILRRTVPAYAFVQLPSRKQAWVARRSASLGSTAAAALLAVLLLGVATIYWLAPDGTDMQAVVPVPQAEYATRDGDAGSPRSFLALAAPTGANADTALRSPEPLRPDALLAGLPSETTPASVPRRAGMATSATLASNEVSDPAREPTAASPQESHTPSTDRQAALRADHLDRPAAASNGSSHAAKRRYARHAHGMGVRGSRADRAAGATAHRRLRRVAQRHSTRRPA